MNKNNHIIEYKDNFIRHMDDFYVAVAVDREGKEGVVATLNRHGAVPFINCMVGASDADKNAILNQAQEVADETNTKIKVIKFSARDVIAEFTPSK